jgi:mono/diheme cytochrome c family protein
VRRTLIAGAALGLTLTGAAPVAGVEVETDEDVKRLFATTCGYCHQGGGREAGRGPALMGTTRSDEYLVNRIATGRQGKMPAYGQTFTLEQIEAIVRYIRGLKPEGGG